MMRPTVELRSLSSVSQLTPEVLREVQLFDGRFLLKGREYLVTWQAERQAYACEAVGFVEPAGCARWWSRLVHKVLSSETDRRQAVAEALASRLNTQGAAYEDRLAPIDETGLALRARLNDWLADARNADERIEREALCRALVKSYVHREPLLRLVVPLSGEIPDVFDEGFGHVKEIVVQGGPVADLPPSMASLPNLQIAKFSGGVIIRIPELVYKLPHLMYLDVSGNGLRQLPARLAECGKLCGLNARNNRLETVPEELAYHTNLVVLRLAGNPIAALPDAFDQLHDCTRPREDGIPKDCLHVDMADTPWQRPDDWMSTRLQRMREGGCNPDFHIARFIERLQFNDNYRNIAIRQEMNERARQLIDSIQTDDILLERCGDLVLPQRPMSSLEALGTFLQMLVAEEQRFGDVARIEGLRVDTPEPASG